MEPLHTSTRQGAAESGRSQAPVQRPLLAPHVLGATRHLLGALNQYGLFHNISGCLLQALMCLCRTLVALVLAATASAYTLESSKVYLS